MTASARSVVLALTAAGCALSATTHADASGWAATGPLR